MMSGAQVFEQIVEFAGQSPAKMHTIDVAQYQTWKRHYVWEALHGRRYGQSFCNYFGITDNHLYYAPGDLRWCDDYIRKYYIERT